jgi:hypothetical protein
MTMPRISNLFAHLCVLLLLAASVLSADAATWTNAGVGDWNTAVNWNPNAVPAASDVALIDNGGTASISANAPDITALRIGYTAISSTGTVNIGANLTATAASEVGRNGVGNLNITNGTVLITAGNLQIGGLATGRGIVTQSGGSVSNAAALVVGYFSTNNPSYTLSGGTLTSGTILAVGNGVGSSGTMNVSGGTYVSAAITGDSGIGVSGTGTLNLSGGTMILKTAGAVVVGRVAGAVGTVNQTGGSLQVSNNLIVGSAASSKGYYSIQNGSLSGGNLLLGVSAGAAGTLTVGTNATVNILNTFTMGATATNNFVFGATSVSKMVFGGGATFTATSVINVDGSAYTGGASNFTLIKATNFTGTPVINLTGFVLGAYATWDAANGDFIVTVTPPGTTVLIRSAGSNPSGYGDRLTFKAVVSPAPPDGQTITFYDGATPMGTGITAGGVATFTASALAIGAHSIRAVYPGDATHNGSDSSALSQTVDIARSLIRVMPVGDSITVGQAAVNVPGGYRAPLYQLLTNAGYKVEFVGTSTQNPAPWLPSPYHEGHSGTRIDYIDSIIVAALAANAEPDIILLLIGTNDYGQGYDTPNATNRLEALIAKIATNRPNVSIIVNNLLMRGEPYNTQIQTTFNPFLPGICARQQALGRRVYFNDVRSAVPLADVPDNLHPNQTGYNKMATNFLGVINQHFAPFSLTGLSPNTGRTNGGTLVTFSGSNFLSGMTVQFGSNAAMPGTLVNSNTVTISSPANAVGLVDVVVRDTDGLSITAPFTYVPPPPPAMLVSMGLPSGSDINLVWLGGTNSSCTLRTATNVAQPRSTWTPVATNVVGANGLSTNRIVITPGEPQRFYRLSIPYN